MCGVAYAADKDHEGVNPFKMGMVAASDSHTGVMGWHPENEQWPGHLGIDDAYPMASSSNIQNSIGSPSVVCPGRGRPAHGGDPTGALFSFVGVELGQLAFVGAVLSVAATLLRRVPVAYHGRFLVHAKNRLADPTLLSA